MPNQANIDENIETVVTNTSSTQFHMLCIYDGHIINNAPVIESPIFVNVDENTEYQFDPDIILNNYVDSEGNLPWQVKILETVDIGDLRLGDNDILLINNQVIDWSQFSQLKWKPLEDQSGANYTSLKILVKDDGDPPRCYSNEVEIVFNVITENQEPTVSDSCIEIPYESQITLTAELFTQDFYDPETNSLGYVQIESLPPSGEGFLRLGGDNITSADLPLQVTVAQLFAGDLIYIDTGEIIVGKVINITFTVFDNVN